MPCREVKQREEYKDTNEPKSIHVEERETTKRGKYLSFFVFDSAFTFLQQTHHAKKKKTLIQRICLTQLSFSTWKSAANRPGESR